MCYIIWKHSKFEVIILNNKKVTCYLETTPGIIIKKYLAQRGTNYIIFGSERVKQKCWKRRYIPITHALKDIREEKHKSIKQVTVQCFIKTISVDIVNTYGHILYM